MTIENLVLTIPLFEELPANERREIAGSVEIKRSRKGEQIMSEDQPGGDVYFIVEGSVKVGITSDEGRELTVTEMEGGDFFGEIAALTGSSRSADVSTLSECEFLVLSRDRFESLLKRCPTFTVNLLKELALRLRLATVRMSDLVLLDVRERLIKELRSLAVHDRLEDGEAMVIDVPPSHRELAARIGTAREIITRTFKRLKKEGVIEVRERKIVVKG